MATRVNSTNPKAPKTVEKICKVCGKTFHIPHALIDKYKQIGLEEPTRCKECNDLKKKIRTITCATCGQIFSITALEEAILKNKYGSKFRIPTYCPDCRKEWRQRNEGNRT